MPRSQGLVLHVHMRQEDTCSLFPTSMLFQLAKRGWLANLVPTLQTLHVPTILLAVQLDNMGYGSAKVTQVCVG